MIEIDGSAGGGQMLRTALTLSAVTGKNFKIENIRGNRSKPGMKRQHLECVKAVKKLCDAKTEGEELKSEELSFKPGNLRNQSFSSNIGTAGSITLLLDTILPITTQFSDSFRLTAKGGTDVKWSPSFAYLKHVKLSLLERFGFESDLQLETTGYYPAGNGDAELKTGDISLDPIRLENRGELEEIVIYSKASKQLKTRAVADRQADEVERVLRNSDISVPIEKEVSYETTDSTGSSICLKAVYENSIAGFDALGEEGKRSEDVAKEVIEDFKSFQSTDSSKVAVDSYMADQLMVLLAIAGGKASVSELTPHMETNLEVIKKFGYRMQIEVSENTKIVSDS